MPTREAACRSFRARRRTLKPICTRGSSLPKAPGPNHITRHGGGLASLEASVGRRLMGLAILVTAREHTSQYDWTVNEQAALKDGLEPAHHRRRSPSNTSLKDLGDKEAALIQFGRELFAAHNVQRRRPTRAR